MIITKAAQGPQLDYSIIEDGTYPVTFFRVTAQQGQYGTMLRWTFTVDEVRDVKIYTSYLTSASWMPGKKLDILLRSMGIDTDSIDMSNFDTDSLKSGEYKIIAYCEKAVDKNGATRLNITSCKPYVHGARGTEPLIFPMEALPADYFAQQKAAVQTAKPIIGAQSAKTAPFVTTGQPGGSVGHSPFGAKPVAGVAKTQIRFTTPGTQGGGRASVTQVDQLNFDETENPNGNV